MNSPEHQAHGNKQQAQTEEHQDQGDEQRAQNEPDKDAEQEMVVYTANREENNSTSHEESSNQAGPQHFIVSEPQADCDAENKVKERAFMEKMDTVAANVASSKRLLDQPGSSIYRASAADCQ
ncbi:hypothetical protein F511_16124 [Dorcoceras hygrometricum]|uniref:Uncharacterized protein n=1 Tax=Dorcoceras hygrometricum TaxID=472368 RepID=A0A2Z7CWU4_9LAMI|nr:hypothetical protein F511_16124 [Dorcoceras hygrometricum]